MLGGADGAGRRRTRLLVERLSECAGRRELYPLISPGATKSVHVERLPPFESISLRLVPWTDESNPS